MLRRRVRRARRTSTCSPPTACSLRDALDRIKQSWISHVFVTDSVHHDPEVLRRKSGGKVKVLSIDWLLAKAISNTHDGRSHF